MVRPWLLALLVAASLAGGLACSSQDSGSHKLLVFAAASLAEAMTDVGASYERIHGQKVALSFGASQSLARQIARGAPADVFISAGMFPVEFLAAEGRLAGAPVDLLKNRLVVVARPGRAGGVHSMEQLVAPGIERVAIASPDLAPAGRYASESLTRLGLWDALKDRLIVGADVRATLAAVEADNADAAIVYETDALIAKGLAVLDIVPVESYSAIVYPAAVVSTTRTRERSEAFLSFLAGDEASGIFRMHGFTPLR